jgi:predicted transcriptional regulator
MTNAEIGFALGISAQTVKNHVTSILRKLAVNDRTQAVVLALRRGWLSIDEEAEPEANDANGIRVVVGGIDDYRASR